MAIAQDIILKALRVLGVVAASDTPTAAEYTDSLVSLNSVVDSWAADPRFHFTEHDTFFTLVAKVGHCIGNVSLGAGIVGATTTATATTVGPHGLETGNKVTVSGCVEGAYNITAVITVTGDTTFTYPISSTTGTATGTPVVTAGDFYTTRPIRILDAFTRASTTDSPLAIISERYWSGIADKAATAAIPTKLLYRPNYPFGQVILYPVPSGTPVLHIKSEKALSAFTSTTAVKMLPPGYQHMLELALAIEIATEYGAVAAPTVVERVKAEFAALAQLNARAIPSGVPNVVSP